MTFTKGDFRRHWLEKRLTKQLGEAWVKEIPLLTSSIMIKLKEFETNSLASLPVDPLVYNWSLFETNVQSKLKKIIDRFFRNIIILGLREGLENPKASFSKGEVTQEFNNFMASSRTQTWITYLLNAYLEDYQKLLRSLSDQLVINPASVKEITRLEIRAYLVERAIARFNRYYSSISVEMQAAINSSREKKYRERDPEKVFRYKWGIRTDNRTTDQCLEINRRVLARMREAKELGVDIDWLKALINQVAVEYDPKWRVRDWVAHYNCRSVLKRVVI